MIEEVQLNLYHLDFKLPPWKGEVTGDSRPTHCSQESNHRLDKKGAAEFCDAFSLLKINRPEAFELRAGLSRIQEEISSVD
ncbi:MAG: hypothetical protein IVW54_17790 [Candidatus Binataceae bacterium]|nr:hypothetical protein [Candidatus Binataceae bacterium]